MSYEDIISKEGILNKSVSSLSRGKKGILFKPNYVLFGKLRPYLGNYFLPNFEGIAVGDFWVLKCNESPLFLYYLIQTSKYKYISNISSGSKMPRSDWSLVSKYLFQIPKLNEQDHVAKILKLLDNLISLQQRKLERLSNLKIGLNQQIFNELDLNKFPQISLHSIGKAYSGLTGKNKNDFGHGKAHYVTYLNINKNTISDINEIEKIDIDPKQNMVKKGDIFFTISSETPNEVGLTSVWPKNTNNLYLNSFCFGYRPDQTKVDSFYLGYLFRSDYFRKKIFPLAQGISRYNLSKKNVLNLNIGLPNMNQQVEIVEILTTLDNEIQSILRKINYLKSIKQFLLQNMFI